jgi:FAD/FMN-containing dehydrogenase
LVALRIAPDAPFVPEPARGKPIVAAVVCYAGPVDEGERALKSLREFGPPVADLITPKPFVAHQKMLEAMGPAGWNYYMKAEALSDLTDETINAVAAQGAAITSPFSLLGIFRLGGAARRVSEDASAYGHRNAEYEVSALAAWPEGDGDRHIQWSRETIQTLQPYSIGVYVNFLGDEGEGRIKAAYGPAKYERLVALKNKYDPTNFFRMNQNIKPSS